jgi:hypothetical protein
MCVWDPLRPRRNRAPPHRHHAPIADCLSSHAGTHDPRPHCPHISWDNGTGQDTDKTGSGETRDRTGQDGTMPAQNYWSRLHSIGA